MGAEGNSRGRRGQPAPYERHVSFSQSIEQYQTGCPPAVVVYCQGIRIELPAAARRLASPFGRGAQCAHWAERAFFTGHNIYCCPLSRLRRQLSQGESQVGVHSFRKISPFLIRLVHHYVSNRVTAKGVGLLPGQQSRVVSGHWPPVSWQCYLERFGGKMNFS